MNFTKIMSILIISLLLTAACSHSNNIRRSVKHSGSARKDLKRDRTKISSNETIIGLASFYGKKFHGRKTANGETFNMHALTAAHKSLPFNTICLVTNTENGQQVKIRVNDRGPFVAGRIMDLSFGAAKAIGALNSGVIKVKIEILTKDK